LRRRGKRGKEEEREGGKRGREERGDKREESANSHF
jgi:hypothetical protein